MTSLTRSDPVGLTADQALAGATSHHSLAAPGSSIEEIASQLIGLHSTSQVSPYLSLRTRLPGFRRTDLDELMWDSWQLVRLRAMRLTMFVFPRGLLEIVAAATRHTRGAAGGAVAARLGSFLSVTSSGWPPGWRLRWGRDR